MQWSYSKVETFKACPYKYKLRYVDKLEIISDDAPDNPLILGRAAHTGIRYGVDEAINEYYMSYPIITDEHINEAIKLEHMIPLAKQYLERAWPGGEYEVKIERNDFIGFIDYMTDEIIIDFKYTKDSANYNNSSQLFLYLFYSKKEIEQIAYLIIPKISIKMAKTEQIHEFRKRLNEELKHHQPYFVYKSLTNVTYANHIIEFRRRIREIETTHEFAKTKQWCFCEYIDYCLKGENYMVLPPNIRRDVTEMKKRTMWIYGAPFTGKTTFANTFPNTLMINTDGNTNFVDAPVVFIKDRITTVGRSTEKILAWNEFEDVIKLLETESNEFKTIVIDLVEDLYEHCRQYIYSKLKIDHESDNSFRAWDEVRTKFLTTLKRIMNLDYENIILISHEDTSRDLTKKTGSKITAIKPNIQEKIANKIAGMVHVVARAMVDGDKRTLQFKTDEVTFGGGRLPTRTKEIALDYGEFADLFDAATKIAAASETPAPERHRKTRFPQTKAEELPVEEAQQHEPEGSPRRGNKETEFGAPENRRRGRPNVATLEVEPRDMFVTQVEEEARLSRTAQQENTSEVPIRRGRGRPRKNA